MNQSSKPPLLNRSIPLWMAVLAVLIAIMASGMFAFGVAFALFQQGIIEAPPPK